MLLYRKIAAISFFASASLAAQTGRATFEAVTIKASPPNDGHYMRGCKGGPGTGDPVSWRCTNATVAMLISQAYDLKRYQLTAPDWTSGTNFEIEARVAPETTKEQFREMIRNLLSERFKLEFHWGKKEMAMYDLVVAKGQPKLKESVENPAGDDKEGGGAGPATDADGYPNISKDCSGCMAINAAGKARYRATKAQIQQLAETIGNQLGMPVNDRTGLTGKYDIVLSWSDGGGIGRRPDADAAGEPGITMETAVQQQLGLKLVSKKGLVDVLVVDKVARNPVVN